MTEEGKALHYSEGKTGVDQVPVEIVMEVGQVFTFGERKYARDNWKQGTDWHQFYGSALRHIFKWWNGEDFDEESGISHLAHAIWNLAALRYYQLRELGNDDRDQAGVGVKIERPVIGVREAAVLDRNGSIVGSQSIEEITALDDETAERLFGAPNREEAA